MRRSFSSLVVCLAASAVLVPALVVGCSDDDPAGVAAIDAGNDSTTTKPDTGTVQTPDSGDVPADDDDNIDPDAGDEPDADAGHPDAGSDAGDAGDAGDGGDGGGCATVAAAYALTGTCNAPGFAPPKVLCVRQSQCALTATDESYLQKFTGTATKTGVTATTDVPVRQDCTGTITSGKLATLACKAPAVGLECTATAQALTLKNATSACCSVNAQDCLAGERCQPVGTPTGVAVNACTPDRGTVNLDGACTRANGDVGDDDCKKGLFCANFGQANATTRVCRKLCTTNADCTNGGCFFFGSVESGVCIERCKLDGSGTACNAGNTCRPSTTYAATGEVLDLKCDFIGAVANGGACTSASDCVAGNTCASGKCAALCDTAHPCAAGTCTKFSFTYSAETEPTTGFCKP